VAQRLQAEVAVVVSEAAMVNDWYDTHVWHVIVVLAEHPAGMTDGAIKRATDSDHNQRGILRSLVEQEVVRYDVDALRWHLEPQVAAALRYMPGLMMSGLTPRDSGSGEVA